MKKSKKGEIYAITVWVLAVMVFLLGCKKDQEEIQPPPPVATSPLLSNVSSVTTTGDQQSSFYEITSEIKSSGGAAITEYGHVYSNLNSQPTLTDSTFKKGAYTGTFPFSYKQNLSKLKPGLTYYVRPFATNEKGTTYGETVKLTPAIRLPELSDGSQSVGESFIKITSMLVKDGGGKITQHGHLLFEGSPPAGAPQTAPALSEKTTLGTYAGTLSHSFSSEFTNLKIGTNYSVYAYATNEAGTVYGTLSTIKTAGSQDWAVVAPTSFAPSSAEIGVSGNDHVWMRGGTSDRNVYQLVSDKWELRGTDIAALGMAVAPDGTPWISSKSPFAYLTYYKSGKWQVAPLAGFGERPNVIDIAIGADGTMWVIGADESGRGVYKVTQFTNGQLSFELKTGLPGYPNHIAADPNGRAWVVDGQRQVWFHNGTAWTEIKTGIAASDVSVSADGTVWLAGHLEGAITNDSCFRLNGTTWEQKGGGLESWAFSIAAGKTKVYTMSNGKVWSRSNAR